MISKSLGSSRRFRKLLDAAGELGEFAQSLYALVVAHADDFGRQDGDAFTVKHEVFPTSKRSEEEFESALQAMEQADLIRRHRFADDRVVLQVDKFEEHQPGLHKRTASKFPEVPGKSRKTQESHASRACVELNRTELNRTELIGADQEPSAPPPVHQFFAKFAEEFEVLAGQKPEFDRGKDAKTAKDLIDRHGVETVLACVDEMFRSKDPWIRQSGYTVGAFKSCFNKLMLAVQKRAPGRSPPRGLSPVCPHEPRCRDGTDACKQRQLDEIKAGAV
jgi:hypothetical protein